MAAKLTGTIGDEIFGILITSDVGALTGTLKQIGDGSVDSPFNGSGLYLGVNKIGINEAVELTATSTNLNQLIDNTFDSETNSPSHVISGTAGNGFISYRYQSGDPGGQGNHTRVWADADGDLSFKKDGGSTKVVATTDDVAALLSGTITNGDTTHAPTNDAVYDALALKADTSALSGYQPLDSDLTSIAGLTPSNDDIIQRKAGAWTNRTMAQLKTDLNLSKSDVGLGSVVNADTTTTANITDSTNKRFITDAQQTVLGNTSGTNTGDQLVFKTIAVSGQSDVVADSTTDTLTFVAGSGMTITTDPTTDSVTFVSSGGGGSEMLTSTATGVQTNLSTSASTSKNIISVLRWTPTSMAILQSINTTSWEDGKILRIVNATSQSTGTGGRLIIIENENGASGTKFSYPRNGTPLMLMPRDYADFSFNSSDGFLYFTGGTSFAANPGHGFDRFTDCEIFNMSSPWLTTGMTYSASGYEGNTTKRPFGVWGAALTTAANTGYYATNRANGLTPAQGCAVSINRVAAITALSDGTNTYIIENGFGDNNVGASTDGAYWRYDSTAASVWRTVTNKASAETVNDQSGFTVSISEYPYLGVFCNNDWTNIQFFYSNDGKTWTIGNVHTTNTPAATNLLNVFGSYRKTAGSTSRSVEWDLVGYRYQFNRGA